MKLQSKCALNCINTPKYITTLSFNNYYIFNVYLLWDTVDTEMISTHNYNPRLLIK